MSQTEPKQRTSWNLMIGLAMGHGVKHFYQQAFLLLIPSFKAAMGLTDVQVGLFGTARTISSSIMNMPAGIIADLWRSKVGLILAASLTRTNPQASPRLDLGADGKRILRVVRPARILACLCGSVCACHPDSGERATREFRIAGPLWDELESLLSGSGGRDPICFHLGLCDERIRSLCSHNINARLSQGS